MIALIPQHIGNSAERSANVHALGADGLPEDFHSLFDHGEGLVQPTFVAVDVGDVFEQHALERVPLGVVATRDAEPLLKPRERILQHPLPPVHVAQVAEHLHHIIVVGSQNPLVDGKRLLLQGQRLCLLPLPQQQLAHVAQRIGDVHVVLATEAEEHAMSLLELLQGPIVQALALEALGDTAERAGRLFALGAVHTPSHAQLLLVRREGLLIPALSQVDRANIPQANNHVRIRLSVHHPNDS
mmetsp:Transcript_42202/g.82550  ORF Transcript_42202/g.82550 Transcript_42202/m.82550 type:complete len:242 (-) Transcript_42202:322-1047(-)